MREPREGNKRHLRDFDGTRVEMTTRLSNILIDAQIRTMTQLRTVLDANQFWKYKQAGLRTEDEARVLVGLKPAGHTCTCSRCGNVHRRQVQRRSAS